MSILKTFAKDLLDSIEEINNELEMANPINYQLLKMYIDIIPCFDGSPTLLNDFCNGCQELVDQFSGNDAQNNFLLRAIKSKLVGQARVLTSTRLELNNWEDIQILLLSNFGDPRDLPCLQQDLLHITFDKTKETLLSFGNKILQHQSLLMSKLRQCNKTLQVKEALAEVYGKLSLDTYVTNLPFNFQQMVRTRECQTLEEAINFVLKEEQFNQYKQSIQKHSPSTSKPNALSNNPFNTLRDVRTPFQSPKYNWPNQPINVQPRQIQQKFPTNKQVFGKPQNVWKPNNQQNNYSPTPMSGVSHAHTHQKTFVPTQRLNNFQSQSRPTFQSMEINNTELDNTPAERTNTYSGIPLPVEQAPFFMALYDLQIQRQQLDLQIEQMQQNAEQSENETETPIDEYSDDSFLEETQETNTPT